MSRTIPATPRSAARSSARIDLVPSRRLAGAWLAWIAVACGVTMGSALPLFVRIAICLLVATTGIRSVGACVLLRGPRAVRSVEWSSDGDWQVYLGKCATPLPATLAGGSFRLGTGLLVLRVETARGIRTVCIDGGRQDPAAFRGLCRRLRRVSGTQSGPDSRAS